MSNTKLIETFKKHITLLCVISTLIIPLLNNFAFSLILSLIDGDIMLATATDLLKVFISSLDTLNLFLVFGVLVNSIVRFGAKKSSDVIALVFLRIFLVYTSYITIGAIVTTNFQATLEGNLYYCLINALVDVMLVVGTIVLCSFLRSKYIDENNTDITIRKIFDKKNPLINITLWVIALVSAFLLSGCIITTISDITNYGASNLNANEVIYLVSPYVKWLLKTIFGYFVVISVAKWLDLQWKNLNSSKVDKQ